MTSRLTPVILFSETSAGKMDMDNTEIRRQREIGKQLLLISIIHHENDHAAKCGYSFVLRDQLAAWTSMRDEDLDRFLNTCACLDRFNLAADAAHDCMRKNKHCEEDHAYSFTLRTYLDYGQLLLLCITPEERSALYDIISKEGFRNYNQRHPNHKVSENLAEYEVIKSVMEYYLKRFILVVDAAIDQGYEWDVICAMLRFNLSQEIFEIIKDQHNSF